MKIKFVFLVLFLIFTPSITFPQTNQTESLTVTTYFPSPNAVFQKMEVKRNLVVGNISDSNFAENKIDDISDIPGDQIFVTDSIILGPQTSPQAPFRNGQIYFNNSTGAKKLEFYNGTWSKLGT
jgi:hypothetical protein